MNETDLHATQGDLGRGTPSGLIWLIETHEPTNRRDHVTQYPHHITGRIIDTGIDRGPFNWHVSSLDDRAYVFTTTTQGA